MEKPAVLVEAALLTSGNKEHAWIWRLVGCCSMGSFAFIPSTAETPWINELGRVVAATVLLAPGFLAVFAAQGAEGLGKSSRSWSPSPRGVKSSRRESCPHQLKLIRVVALVNFTFGCAPNNRAGVPPLGAVGLGFFCGGRSHLQNH